MEIKLSPEQMHQEALKVMPPVFTTKQFCKALRPLGYSEKLIDNNNHLRFLNNVVKSQKPGWWNKENVKPAENRLWSEESCIAYLKSKGYKISKLIEF